MFSIKNLATMLCSLSMTTEWTFFLKGIILGFAIAAPVGPIGILCIRRTLQYGRLSGLFSGLGAAAADAIYACIAAFGLTFVANLLVAGQSWLQMVGGLFLLFLGWRTFSASVVTRSQQVQHKNLFTDFISTFFLTLTNPLTIIAFIALFAGLGLGDRSYGEALTVVIGVLIGSSCWWLMLSEGVTLFRSRVSENVMQWINRFAGAMLMGFGAAAVIYTIEQALIHTFA